MTKQDQDLFAKFGFQITQTGGGCTAWELTQGDLLVWITDAGGCNHEVKDGDIMLVGAYAIDSEGDRTELTCDETSILTSAIAMALGFLKTFA